MCYIYASYICIYVRSGPPSNACPSEHFQEQRGAFFPARWRGGGCSGTRKHSPPLPYRSSLCEESLVDFVWCVLACLSSSASYMYRLSAQSCKKETDNVGTNFPLPRRRPPPSRSPRALAYTRACSLQPGLCGADDLLVPDRDPRPLRRAAAPAAGQDQPPAPEPHRLEAALPGGDGVLGHGNRGQQRRRRRRRCHEATVARRRHWCTW